MQRNQQFFIACVGLFLIAFIITLMVVDVPAPQATVQQKLELIPKAR
jgi:hypothetical protein